MPDGGPRRIGRYEVERELACGGMGVVLLARQPELERRVVLKRMRRELARDAEAEARFRREARTAAAIHHSNVVGVYDGFEWRGEPVIACEYVDGLDAASVLQRGGPLPPRVAGLIALEIARGLEALHDRALVHRDLKPDNVLLGREGEVKVADFGIAHDARARSLTRTGISLGTPAYMAPEQLRGEKVDARADLFALGVLLYELVAGRLPFDGDVPAECTDEDERSLLQRIEQGAWTPLRRARPGTPRALASLVRRCLDPKARRRPASARAVQQRLERWLGPAPPGAVRAEIAGWLADAKVLPARGGTRRAQAPAEEPAAAPSRLRRLAWAAALATLLAAALLLEGPGEEIVDRLGPLLGQEAGAGSGEARLTDHRRP